MIPVNPPTPAVMQGPCPGVPAGAGTTGFRHGVHAASLQMKRKQRETRSRYEMATIPTVDEPGKTVGRSLCAVRY